MVDGVVTSDPNVAVAEGLEFSVFGPPADFKSFEVVANAAGVIDPPEPGAANFGGFATPGDANPTAAQQVAAGRWLIHAGGAADNSYASYVVRAIRSGDNWPV